MTALIYILVYCQAFGAAIGALTAVWSELAYLRAMKDGIVDTAERAHLDALARGLKYGMSLLLLASLGLVIVSYAMQTSEQPALSPSYWILIVLALLVVTISWARSKKFISFSLGSATVFTAWWFLFYLTSGWFPVLSFGAAVAFFVVSTAIIYGIFHYARLLALHKG